MRQVVVNDLVFGNGRMKICVPVCAQTRAAAVEAVREIRGTPADLIEWRLDYFTEDILTAAPAVLEAAGELPLLCTFRTKAEGGEREIDPAAYFALNEALGALGVPMLDLELALCLAHEARAKQAIDALHGGRCSCFPATTLKRRRRATRLWSATGRWRRSAETCRRSP